MSDWGDKLRLYTVEAVRVAGIAQAAGRVVAGRIGMDHRTLKVRASHLYPNRPFIHLFIIPHIHSIIFSLVRLRLMVLRFIEQSRHAN